MKNTFFIVFLCLVCSHQSFSFNKSAFDMTEQPGLYKTGGIQTIYNYGNYFYRAEKTEMSLITGGYFTIGTNKGQSVSDFDNNCGITFGHPYAMTSYPVIGIDGNWGKFDEIHSSLTELSPNKIQDTLQVSFVQDNIVKIFFQMISCDNGESIKLVLKLKNIDTQQHTFGSGLVFDPSLGKWGDGCFYLGNSLTEQERLFEKSAINENLEIWERNSAAQGLGIKINFTNKPDNIIINNWANFYNNRESEFGPLAEKIYDLAVKMIWGETSVEPGQEISSETTVALVEPDFSAPVFLRWDCPRFLAMNNNLLFPRDFNTTIQLLNSGSANYTNAKLLLDNPYEIYGDAEFENVNIPTTGAFQSYTLHSREIYEDKIIKLRLICTNNGAVLDSLSQYVYVPATPVSDTGLLINIDSLITEDYPDINVIFSGEIEATGQKLLNLRKENIFLYENDCRIDRYDVGKDTTGGASAADIIFVLDVTGSMGGIINAVKNNIIEFSDSLNQRGVDYQLGLVTFLDIVENVYPFTDDINTFKNQISEQYAHGGGDGPENSLAALIEATKYDFRSKANRIIIWITDIKYHESDFVTSLTKQPVINELLEKNLITHVVGPMRYKSEYFDPFTLATGGTFYDINGNFRDILLDVSRMKAQDKYKLTFKSPTKNTTNQIRVMIRYAGLGGEATIDYTPPPNNSPGKMLACYPNPFNPDVKIQIRGLKNGTGQVEIYNLLGQRIKKYEINKNAPSQLIWNALDEQGLPVSSGFYIVHLALRNKDGQIHHESQKILYLK
ncbi:VWA domain-containing protein [candidate division KSB1 bacterium]|nr:VWA domain-containing protein [candidate division KSB1 bacterium]